MTPCATATNVLDRVKAGTGQAHDITLAKALLDKSYYLSNLRFGVLRLYVLFAPAMRDAKPT